MKKNDIILLICILVAALVAFLCLWLIFSNSGDTVVVTVDNAEYARLPLDKDTVLIIETPNGTNTLVIKDKKAFIESADCPDKTCVKTGSASEIKTIVCLPHKLTVAIESGGAK